MPQSSATQSNALKDRKCTFCRQTFTSSALGRHLDLYIRSKNPAKPDGIHLVDKILELRGGIKRRQAKSRVSLSTSLPPELSDPDLFALLYPANKLASVAVQQECNATRYVAPSAAEDVGSREPTPAPATPSLLDDGYLALRFSDTDKGSWTLGRHQSCDIILKGQGVSSLHCEIVCQQDNSFDLWDRSTWGTAISYDGEPPEIKKNQYWLIARYPGPLLWTTMEVRIGPLCFNILLPNHHRSDKEYIGNISRFREARIAGLPVLSTLDIHSSVTTRQPGTPAELCDPVAMISWSEHSGGTDIFGNCLSGRPTDPTRAPYICQPAVPSQAVYSQLIVPRDLGPADDLQANITQAADSATDHDLGVDGHFLPYAVYHHH
jgi:hypothetical protein